MLGPGPLGPEARIPRAQGAQRGDPVKERGIWRGNVRASAAGSRGRGPCPASPDHGHDPRAIAASWLRQVSVQAPHGAPGEAWWAPGSTVTLRMEAGVERAETQACVSQSSGRSSP